MALGSRCEAGATRPPPDDARVLGLPRRGYSLFFGGGSKYGCNSDMLPTVHTFLLPFHQSTARSTAIHRALTLSCARQRALRAAPQRPRRPPPTPTR
eukprot:scaffold50229_cov75-Phaeocystis_antarctica.AAC.1